MEENHDEQHFTERELAGSHAFAMRWDQLFPLAIFEDLCKISDTAKQGDDRRVHEGGILSVGFDFGTDTKSGSARFWNTHQPAYPELGLLGNKLEERGGYLCKVPAHYTSQTCSECGTVDGKSRENQASFVCRYCGHHMNADHNAAINILRRNTSFMVVEEGHWPSVEAITGRGVTLSENPLLQVGEDVNARIR